MATRIVHNIATGEITEIIVDNAWILANRPNNILISIPQASYLVGQSAVVTLQLVTPLLVDNTQSNLTNNLAISMQFGDIIQTVNLVNGAFSDTVIFSLPGFYTFKCLDLPSNELIIGVS